jgi:C4-type Zn-finger protein
MLPELPKPKPVTDESSLMGLECPGCHTPNLERHTMRMNAVDGKPRIVAWYYCESCSYWAADDEQQQMRRELRRVRRAFLTATVAAVLFAGLWLLAMAR